MSLHLFLITDMKKKEIIKPTTNSKKKKIKWFDVFITALAIVVIVGFFAWLIIHTYQQEKYEQAAKEKYEATLPAPGVILDHKMVCMVGNLYHGTDQIRVTVSDKTYYGCNQKSVRELNTDEKVRFGIDPYSKKAVDKALAVIAINPDKTGSILYFESKENLRNYFRQHH